MNFKKYKEKFKMKNLMNKAKSKLYLKQEKSKFTTSLKLFKTFRNSCKSMSKMISKRTLSTNQHKYLKNLNKIFETLSNNKKYQILNSNLKR